MIEKGQFKNIAKEKVFKGAAVVKEGAKLAKDKVTGKEIKTPQEKADYVLELMTNKAHEGSYEEDQPQTEKLPLRTRASEKGKDIFVNILRKTLPPIQKK